MEYALFSFLLSGHAFFFRQINIPCIEQHLFLA